MKRPERPAMSIFWSTSREPISARRSKITIPTSTGPFCDTNLNGIVELTQRIGRRMKARGKGGKVINIGSLMSVRGLPYLSIYAITKGGLAQLTMVLAAEWGRDNIQVNCIAPGFILTSLNQKMWQQEGMKEWLRGAQANPKMGTPEDVAALAVFLAGRGANYITGQVIAVDGGYTTTAAWPFQP